MSSSPNKPHVLLLTGTPGIGKTTVIRKVAAALPTHRIGGFYTEEIRKSGQRQGFRLVTFNGEQGIIAHVGFDHRFRVSKYGVDVAEIDRFANAALNIANDIDVYLIDEIGKMECFSERFISRIQALRGIDKPLIATVAKKGGGLIEEVKQWPESELWQVSRNNRDAVVEQVIVWLGERV